MTPGTPLPRLVAAVAVGGALGALARWALGSAFADGAGFPWTTFVINVSGSLLLASLPMVAVIRRSPTLAVALGPGLLGGFTTLSASSEQTRALLDDGQQALAAAYLLGTLAAALVAVAVVSHWSRPVDRKAFADEGGDE